MTVQYPEKSIARFWSKVNKNGPVPEKHPGLGPCWQWMGGGNGQGYGQIRAHYRQIGTHQFAWELVNGEVPRGWFVLHKCDNRACVNPDHLFLGSAKDNMIDMVGKGQRNTGLGQSRHHLTRREVQEVKTRYAEGVSKAQLARDFNIAYNTVSNLVKGKTRNR